MSTDRAGLRAAVLAAADDWRAAPGSYAAGVDPVRILLTIRDSEDLAAVDALQLWNAVADYVDGDLGRDGLVDALARLIPDTMTMAA